MRLFFGLIAAAAFAAAATPMAGAVAGKGPVWSAHYVAAFAPKFGKAAVPYTGDLDLTFNHGVIAGTYRGTSARPDPYRGKTTSVTGGMSHGLIHLRIGAIAMTNGTIAKNGDIDGTATWGGKLFTFVARPRPAPAATH